ncbi:unnamed protein product [Pneumocystis jirovecii]|uniref:Uncharacterized protein n=1 Tax=Pneumocystis jirovecii TaxID=42068 RepID=L0PDU4_PNEJI|nr:unnamed protein product [Pneumocystis jirovecii]
MTAKKPAVLHHHRSKRIDAVLHVISTKKHTSLKADRKNTKKQIQANKKDKIAGNNSMHFGVSGISKIIVIVPLCTNVNPMNVIQNLNNSIGIDTFEFSGMSNIFMFVVISVRK